MKKPPPPTPENCNRTACAMRLRVYPTDEQIRRLGSWLWVAHRFRNEAVAFVENRRRARAVWVHQHPQLAKDWIPEEFSGNDAVAASRWLTGRLEQARIAVGRETGWIAGKGEMTAAVGRLLRHLSRGERDAIPDVWLLSLPRTALNQVLQDLARTLAKAIADRRGTQGTPGNPERRGKKPAGFARFHKWSHAGSVRLQVDARKNAAFRDHWTAGRLFVPGLGVLEFRDSGYVLPTTPPKLITITRDAADRIHMSFLCVEGETRFNGRRLQQQARQCSSTQEPANLKAYDDGDTTRTSDPESKESSTTLPRDPDTGFPVCIGVDVGLTTLATLSDGRQIRHTRYLRQSLRKQQHLSRRCSRRQTGSRRWQKACRQLGKAHARVADRREAQLHQVAQAIVTPAAIVCTETLTLAFLLQNRTLARSAHDAGLGRLLRLVESECMKQGKLLLRCGRFEPTTQACSACGTIHRELKNNLSLRHWNCAHCGASHDRDFNAAKNVRDSALQAAIALFSTRSERDRGTRASPRLHPDLDAFVVRGGLAALRDSFRESRPGKPGTLGSAKRASGLDAPPRPVPDVVRGVRREL